MFEELVNQDVVIDLASSFVCMGRLLAVSEHFLELADADVHDLCDSRTSRENYVINAVMTGVKRNRKRVLWRGGKWWRLPGLAMWWESDPA